MSLAVVSSDQYSEVFTADALLLLSASSKSKKRRRGEGDGSDDGDHSWFSRSSSSADGQNNDEDARFTEQYTARVLGDTAVPPFAQPSPPLQVAKITAGSSATRPMKEVDLFTARESHDSHFGPFHSNAFRGFKLANITS